ncbi:RNA polymerase sigma factor [Nocardioides sambongensis]|uniref:RNA polymerase sigma factor n=1 Tax=Nocardioides sambongensis TaxID=2589074 RepID=UPI001E4DCEEC|nr:sigma-70 family RNA polymerase sigma factor [Nocardioides sambongensis]
MTERSGPDGVDVAGLYAAHRVSLTRLAILLVDDEASAEDVVQDAFAALVRGHRRLRDPAAAVGYLRTSVVNNARSALRRRRTSRGYRPPREYGPADPVERVVLAEEHREVLRALDQLGQRQREVLVLRYWGTSARPRSRRRPGSPAVR